MTKRTPPAAPAGEDRATATYDATHPHPAIAALGAFADAVAVAVKFPNTPVPPAITDRIDQAVANLKAAFAGEAPMAAQVSDLGGDDGEPGSPSVFERLDRLEAFAERTSESLPREFERIDTRFGEMDKAVGALPTDLPEILTNMRSSIDAVVSAPADLAETLSGLGGRIDKIEKAKPAAASDAG